MRGIKMNVKGSVYKGNLDLFYGSSPIQTATIKIKRLIMNRLI